MYVNLSNLDRDQIDIFPLFLNTLWTLFVDIVKQCSYFLTKRIYILPLGSDLPLYPICKELKLQYPESLGEDKFLMQLRAFAYLREVSTDYGNDSAYLKRMYSCLGVLIPPYILSHHHITCSIYVNQVSEMVLTNRSLHFDVRTLQPHRADTCIFLHLSYATLYQAFCMNDQK